MSTMHTGNAPAGGQLECFQMETSEDMPHAFVFVILLAAVLDIAACTVSHTWARTVRLVNWSLDGIANGIVRLDRKIDTWMK